MRSSTSAISQAQPICLRPDSVEPDDAELALVLEQLVEHDPVALFEDVQRHELVRDRHEPEGEQRKVAHGPICHRVCARTSPR